MIKLYEQLDPVEKSKTYYFKAIYTGTIKGYVCAENKERAMEYIENLEWDDEDITTIDEIIEVEDIREE